MLTSKDRRDLESEKIAKLGELLPLEEVVKANLDKGAILRLAICYFKLHKALKLGSKLHLVNSYNYVLCIYNLYD